VCSVYTSICRGLFKGYGITCQNRNFGGLDKILVVMLTISNPFKREAVIVIEGLKKIFICPIMVTRDS